MASNYRARLKSIWSDVRWAFGETAVASPRLFGLYLANTLVSVIFPAGIALSVRGLVNAVAAGLESGQLDTTVTFGWLVLGFSMSLGSSLSFSLTRYLAARLELELRPRMNEQVLRKQEQTSYRQFETQEYRDALARAQDAPEIPVGQLCGFVLELAAKSVQITSLAVILLLIEPLLFVMLVPIGIPYLIYQWRIARQRFDEVDQRVRSERLMRYYRGLLSSLEQFGEIKLLGLGPLLRKRYSEIMAVYHGLLMHSQNLEYASKVLFTVLSTSAVYIALGFAAFSIVEGGLTIGDLAIFASAAAQLRSLIEQSVTLVSSSRWQVLHVRRLRQYLDLVLDVDKGTMSLPDEFSGKLELRDVHFRYPGGDGDAVCNINLDIAAGEIVALVGRNGAGKSTLAKLLAGFYQPDKGQILVDGRNLRDFEADARSRLVSLIPQTFGRYAVTVEENIAFGDWDRLHDNAAAVRDVARRAGVDDTIRAMPDGYNTVLGREFGGYEPSGGQWQQLAIARMMARDAPVLILDEPTANLDVEAEYELFQKLRLLTRGRTTLLISHRFSTVSMADRIVVIDKGTIVESGSHSELMAFDGSYAGLYRLAGGAFSE